MRVHQEIVTISTRGPGLIRIDPEVERVVAAARNGLTERRATVHLPGGPLEIDWRDDQHLAMTGPATTVYSGEYDWSRESDLVQV